MHPYQSKRPYPLHPIGYSAPNQFSALAVSPHQFSTPHLVSISQIHQCALTRCTQPVIRHQPVIYTSSLTAPAFSTQSISCTFYPHTYSQHTSVLQNTGPSLQTWLYSKSSPFLVLQAQTRHAPIPQPILCSIDT